MENRSSRCVPFIAAVALVSGCGAPMAAFTGTVDTQAIGVVDAVVIAESLSGARYAVPVSEAQRFSVSVPAGDTYRLSIASASGAGAYRVVSRVHVETDLGWARYVAVPESTIIDLGRVHPIDWARLRTAATTGLTTLSVPTQSGAQLTTLEDPGTGGGGLEDPGVCDEGSGESAGTTQLVHGEGGVARQLLGGGEVKVTICHVPPGDPTNAHAITIGFPALDAHLAHHDDYLGPCQPQTPPDPPDCDDAEGQGVDPPPPEGQNVP
jgi:hypothetical protein